MKATIEENMVRVQHSIRPDVGREFLSIDIDGWDDVKKLSKKVLNYEGKLFTFCGWNSDTNKCNFMRLINQPAQVAKICKQ